MDEELIVLGAPAETQAAGAEASDAADLSQTDGAAGGTEETGATPGTDTAEPAAEPKPEGAKPEGADGEADRPRKRSGIQRMQDRIHRLEAELASSRSQPAGDSGERKTAIEKEIGAAPKESDFEDYVAFEDAKADYRIAKALAEQRLTDREAQASSRQTEARQAAIEAFEDRMDEAREKISDFDTVVKSAQGREVASHVQELVVESEKSALLTYYLAKNPEKLAELNRMGERAAAKAVGALEHRLTLATPKRTPSAPAPAKPVSGGAAPSSPDAEIDAWLAKTYGRGR